jgi:hypothetical protein
MCIRRGNHPPSVFTVRFMRSKNVRAIVYLFVLVAVLGIALFKRISRVDDLTVHILENRLVQVKQDTLEIWDLYLKLKNVGIDENTEIVIITSRNIPMGVVHDVREIIMGAGGVKISYQTTEATQE